MSKQRKIFNYLEKNCQISSTTKDAGSICLPNEKKCKKASNRKYRSEYLNYGFTYKEDANVQIPQCVICSEILSNDAMKPSKLLRHLGGKHKEYMGRSADYFRQKEIELKSTKQNIEKFLTHNKAALSASFLISLRIAQAKKPYTIAENLILPCIIDATKEILGENISKKMTSIPVSNNTVTRRIETMALDVENQLISSVQKSTWFSLQIDESTDVSNKAMLMVYVKFIDFDKKIECEEFLACLELKGRTTGDEMFKTLNDYFQKNNLSWVKCVGLCTDGAASMTGRKSGLASLIKKEVGKDLEITHCIIHREMLASKRMIPELNSVLSIAVHVINFIKSHSCKTRLFSILCEEMGSPHINLLLHTEIRWLSRGRMLNRIFELREEVYIFLINSKSDFGDYFQDNKWLAKLAYLSDIFQLINELNLSLQGSFKTVFDMAHKIEAFKRKLKLWLKRTQEDCFDMFPLFSELISTQDDLNIEDLSSCIQLHLNGLGKYFEEYFPENAVTSGNLWIIDPFLYSTNNNLCLLQHEQLCEISSDLCLKEMKSGCNSIFQFWIKVRAEYLEISENALKILLPFHTTYLCEAAFSALSEIKTKKRNRLEVKSALRLATTSIRPDIEKLVNQIQAQGSH